MAKIVDPDTLGSPYVHAEAIESRGVNDSVAIDTTNFEIQLFSSADGLSEPISTGGTSATNGTTLQCLYSFLKEEWKNNATLIKLPFPLIAITEEKFDWINGWNFSNLSDSTNTDGSTTAASGAFSSTTYAFTQRDVGRVIRMDSGTDSGTLFEITVVSDGDNVTVTPNFTATETTQSFTIGDFDEEGYLSNEMIRDAGWSVRDANNVSLEEWIGVVTLGTFDAGTDQAYFQTVAAGTATDVSFAGEVNQAIQVYSDVNGDGTPDFDYRSSGSAFFKIFLREPNKLPAQYDLVTEQNLTTLDYKVFKMPLSNGTDLKADIADSSVSSTAPDGAADTGVYANMEIQYYTTGQSRGAGFSAGAQNFSIIVDADTTVGETASGAATAEEIYEFVQYSLRRNADINDAIGTQAAGAVTGKTADELMEFVGDTLITKQTSAGDGVYIESFNSNDTNRIQFTADNGTVYNFPFVAAGNLVFNNNLQNDPYTVYRMFFDDPDGTPASGDEFGTTGAILVDDNSVTDISGDLWTNVRSETAGAWTAGGSVITNATFVTADVGKAVLITETGNDLNKRFVITSVVDGVSATVDGSFEDTIASGGEYDVIQSRAQVSWDFDYENNTQGTRTADTDADVTIVAIGLGTGQYVQAAATITKNTGQNFTLVAALERNYNNPV